MPAENSIPRLQTLLYMQQQQHSTAAATTSTYHKSTSIRNSPFSRGYSTLAVTRRRQSDFVGCGKCGGKSTGTVSHCRSCQTQRRLRQSGFDSLSVCSLYSHAPKKAAEPNWLAHAWLRSTEVQVRQPNGATRILLASDDGRSCRRAGCRKGVPDSWMS